MINAYNRFVAFSLDGEVIYAHDTTILLDESKAVLEPTVEAKGETFDSLWNYMDSHTGYSLAVPANQLARGAFSKKRRIEFFFCVKSGCARTWVESSKTRKWEMVYFDEPCSITMKELLNHDAKKVAQYLKERNLTLGA